MFTVTFNTANNAFEKPNLVTEVTRVLREIVRKIEIDDYLAPGQTISLQDVNGNTIGYAEYEPEFERKY